MASIEKVRKYLEASDSHQHYSEIVEYTLTFFMTKAEQEGNMRFADDLRKTKEEYREDFNRAIEATESVYCEVFTDEDLDNLIVLHSNPSLKKARDLTGAIVKQVLERYSQVSR